MRQAWIWNKKKPFFAKKVRKREGNVCCLESAAGKIVYNQAKDNKDSLSINVGIFQEF